MRHCRYLAGAAGEELGMGLTRSTRRKGMSTVRKVLVGVGGFFLALIFLGGIYGALNPGFLSSTTLSSSTGNIGNSQESTPSTGTSAISSSMTGTSTSYSIQTSRTNTCPLWNYPPVLNDTIHIENSTLLMKAQSYVYIPVQPGKTLYVGFSVDDNVKMNGEVMATSPINVFVVGNSGGDVFPYNYGDSFYFAKTNTTDAKISIYTQFFGDQLPVGNYALVFTNHGTATSNVTITQDVVVLYPSC
jgi:hypothetical protein